MRDKGILPDCLIGAYPWKTKPEKLDGNLWSARNEDRQFGSSRINWYDNHVDKKTDKHYGTVKWYRYWKPEGEK